VGLLARERGNARLHRRGLKLAAQAVAVTGVAVLLGVLVWRLVRNEGPQVPAVIHGPIPAPNFELPQLGEEGKLTLSSLRGKALIVNFWASYCLPCRSESGVLESAWRGNRRKGLVVLGVDVEDFASEARTFARRHGLTYPLLYDRSGKTLGPYGVEGIPTTFFVDRRGRIIGSRIRGGVDLDRNRQAFARGVRLALRQ
jgi:peroxiredoxin